MQIMRTLIVLAVSALSSCASDPPVARSPGSASSKMDSSDQERQDITLASADKTPKPEAAPEAAPRANVGVISYWFNPGDYDTIPASAVATINPACGVMAVEKDEKVIDKYKKILEKSAVNGSKMLAYVNLGYGVRTPGQYSCPPANTRKTQSMDEIKAQIDGYLRLLPGVAGFFFDEADYGDMKCEDVKKDWAIIREHVKKARKDALIAWNPGWVGHDLCFVDSAERGEIVAVFENSFAAYTDPKVDKHTQYNLSSASKLAAQRGVLTWHLVHSTAPSNLPIVIDRARREFKANFVYVTELLAKDPKTNQDMDTWGKPPAYWEQEKQLLQSP